MTEVAAVAWDVDGTLVDSEPLHLEALLAVAGDCGLDVADVDETTFLGMGWPSVWRFLNLRTPMPLSQEAWTQAITEYYVTHAECVSPRDGTVDAVARLDRLGFRQVCVSGSGRPVVEANLSQFPLRDRLEFILSRDDVAHSKPDPEPYLLACRRLGLDPPSCLAVEDSPPGVQSAKAAGLFAVAWPQHDGLWFPEADIVIDSLAGLFDTLLDGRPSD
jgi:HAD superfamily hydrolase (TIGR01509 family)